MIKHLKIILLCILPPLMVTGQDNQPGIISNTICTGYIYIKGNTNVNKFNLTNQLSERDIKLFQTQKVQDIYEIEIPAKNFKSDNPLLYNDFLELIKANVYPNITIGISYPELLTFLSGEQRYNSQFEITIAGVTNDYSINCSARKCTENHLYIDGVKKIDLTDFNLVPPVKFSGLVKVNKEVIINFAFVFEIQETQKLTYIEGKH